MFVWMLMGMALECDETWKAPPDGAELFERVWVENDPRSPAGDGLGPTYNDRSCAACHNQGGLGGAGPVAKNVVLAVTPAGTLVQHRVDPSRQLGLGGLGTTGPLPVRRGLGGLGGLGGLNNMSSSVFFGGFVPERQTPALFGMGLLDAIPDADLLAAEALGTPDHPEVSGRLARDTHDRIGRFGWKGQTHGLDEFVEHACSNELGLQTTSVDQPGFLGPGADMDDADLYALAGFVRDLAPPRELEVPGAAKGKVVFQDLGCDACHAASVGGVDGAYTDLMVHDMGPALMDNAGGYGFGGLGLAKTTTNGKDPAIDLRPATALEWRTPPLWGLRDSAPYLHDGRAPTISEAIQAHDGEARTIREAWQHASIADREALETFLQSLAAPAPNML